jgi:hypothetical protein
MSGILAKVVTTSKDPASQYILIEGPQPLEIGPTNVTIKRVGVDHWLGFDGWQPAPCRIASELQNLNNIEHSSLLKLDRRIASLIPYGSGIEIFIEAANIVVRIRWDKPYDLESLAHKEERHSYEPPKTVVATNVHGVITNDPQPKSAAGDKTLYSNRSGVSANGNKVGHPEEQTTIHTDVEYTTQPDASQDSNDILALGIGSGTQSIQQSEGFYGFTAINAGEPVNSPVNNPKPKHSNYYPLISLVILTVITVSGYLYYTNKDLSLNRTSHPTPTNEISSSAPQNNIVADRPAPRITADSPPSAQSIDRSSNAGAGQSNQTHSQSNNLAEDNAHTRDLSPAQNNIAQCDIPVATRTPPAAGFRIDLQIQQTQAKISEGKLSEAEQALKRFVKTGNPKAAELLGELLDPTRGAKLRSDPICSIKWYEYAEFMGLDMARHKFQLEKWQSTHE